MKHISMTLAALLFTSMLGACTTPTASAPEPGPPVTPGPSGPVTPAPTGPNEVEPYTMKGVVKNAQGEPLAGVQVWADNTLYYNMNVLATTDAQGRYTIRLPRELGTWRAGGRFSASNVGAAFELSLEVDQEQAFHADAGAIRNFTLLTSGQRPDGGYYGGTVWVYGNYSNGNFSNSRVELTLTPDGPLMDGSAGKILTRFVEGNTVVDVPLGRYVVTARYLPEGAAPQAMVVMRQDETVFQPSTTLVFRKEPQYGIMADFNLKLAQKQ